MMSRFVIDVDGTAHIVDGTKWWSAFVAQDRPTTWCERVIQRSWITEDSPPLVCGACVIALIGSTESGAG